jgi:hypothetical protein
MMRRTVVQVLMVAGVGVMSLAAIVGAAWAGWTWG